MNQGSLDWEQVAQRRAMNVLHAGFSIGAVLGALGAGLGISLGWRYPQVLIVLALLVAGVALVTLLLRYPPRVATAGAEVERGQWWSLLRRPTMRILMGILVLSLVIESVVFLWSVIYLRAELNASAWLGGAGFALFNGTMFAGRIVNAPLVAARGARPSLLLSGLGLLLGSGLLLVAQNATLAVLAFALLGLGVAGIFPTVAGAAGDLLPGRSGELTGLLMVSTYLGLLATPPVVGWVAEVYTLRTALGILMVCSVGVLVLARQLETQATQMHVRLRHE